MNRRDVLALLSTVLTGAQAPAFAQPLSVQSIAGVVSPDHPLQASWEVWKSQYLQPDGRVVDGYQDNASHSEGQGYGLALAAAFGDLPAFETIFRWSEDHLAIRPDALLAWRWFPDQTPSVPDTNNASDGDLFYAWALAAMAARHDRPDFAERALQIALDLVRLCVVPDPGAEGRFLFLPGAEGFKRDGSYIINPSYYMPRAMRELAVMTGVDALAQAADDSDLLFMAIAEAGMVPDWIEVGPSGWTPPPELFSSRSGYEAIRVPLYAVWSGLPAAPSVRRYIAAVSTSSADATGVVFDRETGEVLESSSHPGYRAIAALSVCAANRDVGAAMPAFSRDQPYYPATLHLMTLVIQSEKYPQCVPL
ncbi:glycosyl hydrolase family 8 [Phaeobacter sp. B1627]|uniref:glycosyl hydrolase family 8 n=1 Tax=Phaeobacter sp. B1627 TaxID=2583809 RepID=UPI00111A6AE9|nr:glycosyl hydrolase family 8 [Phaeobacter sp. B1627]TNJ45118.1 glycosyl hydrolase family 5 [Phaeobacter sp. B1627]